MAPAEMKNIFISLIFGLPKIYFLIAGFCV